jgi:hypothetical protein
MRRKNTRRFDPRYFMDEKTEKPKAIKENIEDPAYASQFGSHLDDPSEMPEEEYTEELEVDYTKMSMDDMDYAMKDAIGPCWHDTKHRSEEDFIMAFNKCMREALAEQ